MVQHSPAKKSHQNHLLAATLVSEATSLCRPLPGDGMTILDYIVIGVDRFDPGRCSQLFWGMITRANVSACRR
jgi:hypothetical protein